MTRTSPAQVAFSSGEISPLLRTRFDYQRYQTGLAECRGFIPLVQGGVTRAPGTLFRGRTRGNAQARLIPFEFAANDTLVLEFTPGWMRVWRYGELVLSSGGTPYQLATPYDVVSLERLSWVQAADVIWIADGRRVIHKLSRLALNEWTLVPAAFNGGPFRVQNLDENRRIRASATTGAITLTANSPIFEPDHVASLLQISAQDYADIPLWTGNTDVMPDQKMRYDGNVYELVEGDNTGVNPPQHSIGVEQVSIDPIVRWRFLSDGVGIVRIISVDSPTSATASVIKALPPSVVTDLTYRWSEGAWSGRYGYPCALEIHDQRLVAAASPTDPRTVWFSTVGDYQDFTPGLEADSSFAYSIAGGSSVNRILWLKSGRDGLHVGALGEEYSTQAPDRSQPLSATNIMFRFGSSYGSREHSRPIAPDGLPIFVSKDSASIVEIAYSLEADSNVATVLSKPADHLGALGFAEIVWQGAPQRLAWIRCDNGDLVAMVYDKSEEVIGWAPVPVAGGRVESLTVTRDATGTRNVVLMVVRREIGGQTVRMVEEHAQIYGLLPGDPPSHDAVHLFAATQVVPSSPLAAFSVPHLTGQAVHAWTDKGRFGPLTVPVNGILVLPVEVSAAVIGLFDDTHVLRSLPLVPPANDGTTLHRRKRLSPPIGVGLHRSSAGMAHVVETDFGQTERPWDALNLVPQPVASDQTRTWTGIAKPPLTCGYCDEIALGVRPVGGCPLTLTAIVPTISEAGI